jgi:hypothetical protein
LIKLFFFKANEKNIEREKNFQEISLKESNYEGLKY